MKTIGMGSKPESNDEKDNVKTLKTQVKDLTTENKTLKTQVKDLTEKLAAATPAK